MGTDQTLGYAYPVHVHATVDLRDPVSKAIYDHWFLNNRVLFTGDNKSCYLHIGIKRS